MKNWIKIIIQGGDGRDESTTQPKQKIRPHIQKYLDRLKVETARDIREAKEIEARWDNGWWF